MYMYAHTQRDIIISKSPNKAHHIKCVGDSIPLKTYEKSELLQNTSLADCQLQYFWFLFSHNPPACM